MHRPVYAMLGCDDAGKTTFILRYLTGLVRETAPTERVQRYEGEVAVSETLAVPFTIYDYPGFAELRRESWEDALRRSDAVLFFVDGTARERLEEARRELRAVLRAWSSSSTAEEGGGHARGGPIAVVLNKRDSLGFLPIHEIVDALGIESQSFTDNFAIFECSGVKGIQSTEVLQWVTNFVRLSSGATPHNASSLLEREYALNDAEGIPTQE